MGKWWFLWDLLGFTWQTDIATYGKSHVFFMGKSTKNWSCSIIMLNYQRVCIVSWFIHYKPH